MMRNGTVVGLNANQNYMLEAGSGNSQQAVTDISAGGKLGAGSGGIGGLTLNSTPVLGGTVVAEVNRNGGIPLADLITLAAPITYSGTLQIVNTGAPLQLGDTFTLFTGGNSGSFTITSQTLGQVVTWDTSNLATLGTVSVASVAQVSLVSSVSGSTLNLTWPPNQLGMTLQTNSVSVVDPLSWYPLAGSTATTNVNITIDPNLTNVFFRLVYP